MQTAHVTVGKYSHVSEQVLASRGKFSLIYYFWLVGIPSVIEQLTGVTFKTPLLTSNLMFPLWQGLPSVPPAPGEHPTASI